MGISPFLFNESGLDIPLSEKDVHQIIQIIKTYHNARFKLLEIAIVDEQEIVRINKKFLKRDYITDTISFRYDDASSNNDIEATIYICAHRVIEQARELGQEKKNEFLRILIHGLLHTLGFEDRSEKEKEIMNNLEDTYLENFYQQ